MTTVELINYIKHQIEKKTPKDLIVSRLAGVGWYQKDIDEAFRLIEISEPINRYTFRY
jgi:hypothetical protein